MTKWIFVVVDLLLLGGCAWTLRQFLGTNHPYAGFVAVAAIIAWMYGAWICISPWVEEFRAETKRSENESLADSLAQIQRIEEVASRIQAATGSWQSAQDSAARTATTAKEVHERIKTDMKDFMDFSDRVNSEEKKRLQLEIDKLRRAEGEWLQVTARMLDHTFALNQAAQRSGQPHLVNQLNAFQQACRDSVRRMGLVPFQPVVGDAFDGRAQQLEDPNAEPAADARITDILATGYMFQGQLLRRALVRVASPLADAPAEVPVEDTAPAPEAPAPVSEPAAESHSEPPTAPAEGATEERPAEVTTAEIAPEPPSEPEVSAQPTAAIEEPSTASVHVPAEPLPVAELEQGALAAEPEPKPTRTAETGHAALASRASANSEESEAVLELTAGDEEQPKRIRRRKPDPQASLPF